jgi:hypothetical protein
MCLSLLIFADVREREEMLHDCSALIQNWVGVDGCPEFASILAAQVNFGAALKRGVDLCRHLRIGSARHQEVKVLSDHLIPVVSG